MGVVWTILIADFVIYIFDSICTCVALLCFSDLRVELVDEVDWFTSVECWLQALF